MTEYTLAQAKADFDYIVKSLHIAFGNASLRGELYIDAAIVAAALKAEKAREACDNHTRDTADSNNQTKG